MQPKPTEFRGYTNKARKIEVIIRMTGEDGKVEENLMEDVDSAVCLVRLASGDVRTVMLGEPMGIYRICEKSGSLITQGLQEIMDRIKK